MVRATNHFTARLFADDTSLTAVGSDLDVLIDPANKFRTTTSLWTAMLK